MPAAHEPTDDLRRQVRNLAALGVPHREIAPFVGISPPTLRKHYAVELQRGKWEANAKVAQSLYQQATNGNVTACIFWLKAQAGWRDSDVVVEGEDGSGVNIIFAERRDKSVEPADN